MAEKKEKRYVSDNAQLMAEWNWGKNNELGLFPYALMCGSGKKVWWKCSKGHEWEATIDKRNRGTNCPYCSGNKVLNGYNDLKTVNPSLAKEWNYEKNGDLKPELFTANSHKKVWWKCNKGHEWQAPISNRNKGVGCPTCNSERHTSFPEYAITYYLKKCGVDVVHSYKGQGYELDIYIPTKNVAIEYDGYFWHKNKTKIDLEKNKMCVKDGIKLYRIREGLPSLNDTSIDFVIQENQKDFSEKLEKILSEIVGINIDVDIEKDTIAIENLREYTEKKSSIVFSNPSVANKWNYEKNGNLKPEHFAANSNKKVWWKCQKGHEWQTSIASRNSGYGCPYCSGLYAIKGETDLQTVNPILVDEWNYEKNGNLKPEQFTANSGEKVWWKCNKGHEWQAKITHRNNGSGCPYCSGRNAIKGETDLQTVNPALAKEWYYKKNGDLKPEHFTANSGEKAWWVCEKGHAWQAKIADRNKGRGCPYCSSKKVLIGYNDLQSRNPVLVKEWNYEKNKELTPAEVMPNSNKKVWWKCSNGHEWQATINSRNNGAGCPVCAKEKRKTKL